jgi:hypothetical protein
MIRRQLFRSATLLLSTGPALVALSGAGMAQTAAKGPRIMQFSNIRPGVSADVFVPDGWNAGEVKGGEKVLSDDPKLSIVGLVVGPGSRAAGELRCLERPDETQAVKWFAELARLRYKAKAEDGKVISGTLEKGDYVVKYRTADGRLYMERIVSGSKFAVSLFMSTVANQALLDDIQAILLKSKLVAA